MTHELKTWPGYFQAVLDGRKTFEVRRDDRGYAVGQVLVLREWDLETGYTGRSVRRWVSYLLRGPALGVADGWVVMALSVHGG